MDKRTVYTDSSSPDVELWVTSSGLSVRNGKQGKPRILTVSVVDTEEDIAAAFFSGLSYARA